MPMNYRFEEKPERPRATNNLIVQISVVFLVAAAVLAWQTPIYWAQRFVPHAQAVKARPE